MPEGPEVSQISQSLNKLVKNKVLKNVKILQGGKYENKAPNNYEIFTHNLPQKVLGVKNKGKIMYWEFGNGNYMYNHLNMTGFWSVDIEYKHSALCFVFDNFRLFYTDIRRFGKVEFLEGKANIQKALDKLGPDILNDKGFKFKQFLEIVEKKKRTNITRFLMDQGNISGIGNYLKAEILYESKISPHRTVGSLNGLELKVLYDNAKKITNLSYQSKGMSKTDYRDLNGEKGDFQRFLKVYSKDKDPSNNKVKSEKTKDGRTTYWVPEVQI